MQVDLIAHTVLAEDYKTDGKILDRTEYTRHRAWSGVTEADELAEFAGRSCYTSWQRPNPATATNKGYIANILSQGHFSVLEHATATFYVQGVSRALTHELIRHRHLSYSQLSQRFVAEDRRATSPVTPPLFKDDKIAQQYLLMEHSSAMATYEQLVQRGLDMGATRKQAREAARAVLPNAQPTSLVVTGNLRAWRDVIAKRNDPAADKEIQQFAGKVLDHLKIIAPNTFSDF